LQQKVQKPQHCREQPSPTTTLINHQLKVNSLRTGTTSKCKESIRVQFLLAWVGSRTLALLLITHCVRVHLLMQLLHIHHRHLQLGVPKLATGIGLLNDNVGAMMVELVSGKGGPGHRKQTLVRVGASGNVVRDLDWPLIVDIRAALGVLPNDSPCLAPVVRERELACSTTVTGLGHTTGWRELFGVLDLEVPETNRDDLTGLVGSNRTLLVAT